MALKDHNDIMSILQYIKLTQRLAYTIQDHKYKNNTFNYEIGLEKNHNSIMMFTIPAIMTNIITITGHNMTSSLKLKSAYAVGLKNSILRPINLETGRLPQHNK